jgi:dTDP-4-amino-4,6-dideoxygalactose transaminase/predicted dehydrogenase
MTLRALQSGKHVLVEKPPLLDPVDKDIVLDAAHANNCVVMPVAQHRFDPVVGEVIDCLRSGALGEIRMLRAHLECARPPQYYIDSDWRGSWKREGGSVLINQGYHILDLVRLIGGKVNSISAEMATFGQANKTETEGTVAVLLRFQSGALGSITVTGAAGSQWSSYLEILGTDGEVAFTINQPGTVPRFKLNNKPLHIHWQQKMKTACGHAATSSEYSSKLSHLAQIRAFVEYIAGQQTSRAASWEEAVETVKLAMDIYTKARQSGAGSQPLARPTTTKGSSIASMTPAAITGGIWKDTWEDVQAGDVESVTELLRRGELSIVSGGLLSRFEQRFASFAGVQHAVAFNNGTSSIYSALWAIGVRAGDDVIICDYGFHGMAAAVLALGARLVVCDCDSETLGLDPNEIALKRTPRSKAILVHNPWGVPARFDRIRKAAEDLPIIADGSHAHGATFRDKPIAAWADITCFSLGRFKLISGGELGCAVTNNIELRDKMLVYGHVNRVPSALRSLEWRGNTVGLKFRPHPVALSLALSQLGRINEKLKVSRQSCQQIEEICRHCDLLPQSVPDHSQRSYWKLVFRLGPKWSSVPTLSLENSLRAEQIPVEPNHYWPLLQDQTICEWPDYRQLVLHSSTPIAHRTVPRTITLAAPVRLDNESLVHTSRAITQATSRLDTNL